MNEQTAPAQMTPGQRQAIAKAKARLRLQQQGQSSSQTNPIVTAQRQSQTQAMSQWAAQQEARKAAEAADAARRQQARREASRVNMGDFIVDENAAPIQTDYEKDIGKGMAGAPLSFGQGLAEGGANLINNVTNIGAEGLNAANRLLLGPKAYQFTGTNIQVPRNVLIGEGAPLESVSAALPRGAGQMMAVRMPLGKLKPGGGLPGMAIKDAASFAATTDKDTSRLVDMLPAGTPVASALQSREGEGYTEAFLKNAAEDLTMSGASAGVMKLLEMAMGAGGSAGRQAARAPEPEPTPAPAPQVPAPTVQPFSAPAEPAGGGLMRSIGTRAVGGGIGATLGGVGDAWGAEGDGSRGGPDFINPVTGGVAGMVGGQMVPRVWRAGARVIRPAGFDERVASRVVRNALSPVGRTADEIAAAKVARFGDKPAPLADLTQQGQNLAVGLTRLPGQAGQLAVQQSEDVLRTRTGRLFSDVETTTKINPASVAGDLDEAIKLAAKEISPEYRKLYTTYQTLASDRLAELSSDRFVSKYLKAAQQQAKSRAITAGLPYSDAHVWDLVKRGMDRTIDKSFSGGKKPSEALLDAREAVRAELDNLMGEYQAIREAADAPRMRAARVQGKKIAGGNMLVERVRAIASKLEGRPLTALQMGAVEELALDIERGRGIDGIASERMREILGAVFDDDTAAKLVARIRADQTIIKNAQRRNPNLGTATPQAMMGGAGGIQNAADLAQNALALKTNPLATVLAALSKSGTYTKAQRDLIAQMLLGGADPENLARIYGRRGGPTRGQPTPPAGPPVNPLTPPRRPPEQSGFGGGRKLPMDEASRMARAEEQGFDTRYKLFHATSSDFDAFDTSKIRTDLQLGEDAIFLTNSPAVADSYLPGAFVNRNAPAIIEKGAQGVDLGGGVGRYYSKGAAVYPVYARNLKDYDVWDMGGGGYDPEFMQRAIKEAKESGAPGIILRGVRDPGIMDNIGPQGNPRTPAAVVVVFDPKDIRSVNATFDPAETASSKLLAGTGANATGLGGAGGAVAGYIGNPVDANGDGVINDDDRGLNAMGGLVTGLVGGGLAGAGANRLLGPRRGVSKAGPQKLQTGPGFGTEADYLRAVKEGDDAFRANAEKITQAGGFGDYKVSLRYPIDSELRGASFNVTKNGEVVGTFDLYSPGHTQELSLHAMVKPEFQRQGVATQFYDFVESTTGKKLRKSETMSPEGKALWAARERGGPQKPPAQSGFGGGNISMRSYTQAAPEELDEWFDAEVEQVAKSGKTTTLRLKSSPETQVGTLRKLNDVHINFKNDGPGLAVDMTFRGGHSAAKYTANPKDVAAATRIFAKTLAAINVYVRKNTPAYITFYGATEAHTRLYKKLMERANINGYTPIVDRGSSAFMNKSAATGDVIGSTTPRVFERFMLIKDEELARFQRERPGAITAFSYPSVGTDGAPVIATAKNYAERTPIRR